MDSINPFDQFGAELQSALPDAGNSAPLPGEEAPKEFDLSLKQPKETSKEPVMGSEQMSNLLPMGGTNNNFNAIGGGYGQPQYNFQPAQQMHGMQPMSPTGSWNVGTGSAGPAQPMYNNDSNLLPGSQPSVPMSGQMMMQSSIQPQLSFEDSAIVPSSTPSNPGEGLGDIQRQVGHPMMQPVNTAPQYQVNQWNQQPMSPPMSPLMSPPMSPVNVPSQGQYTTLSPTYPTSPPPAPVQEPPAMPTFDEAPPAAIAGDFGMQSPVQSPPPANNSAAMVPSASGNCDPFGLFDAPPPSEAAPVSPAAPLAPGLGAGQPPPGDEDFFGFFSNNPVAPPTVATQEGTPTVEETQEVVNGCVEDEASNGCVSVPPIEGLPSDGKVYEVKIHTSTLGVVFLKPDEVRESLYLQAGNELFDALEGRPVVAYMVDESSARDAGIKVGHVLVKVNDMDVKSPRDATDAIGRNARPLKLTFFVPNLTITVAEGMHMVKYDESTKLAPPTPHDWKPKYVVIGGIIGKEWQINMFRSKTEYDIAVMETLDGRPVSVKVKQFGLYQGTRIVCNNFGEEVKQIRYKNANKPWMFIIVKPPGSYPIKISSTSPEKLMPVHTGIQRVLHRLAEQREEKSLYKKYPSGESSPRRVADYKSPHASSF